jgi:hypothetical protein
MEPERLFSAFRRVGHLFLSWARLICDIIIIIMIRARARVCVCVCVCNKVAGYTPFLQKAGHCYRPKIKKDTVYIPTK